MNLGTNATLAERVKYDIIPQDELLELLDELEAWRNVETLRYTPEEVKKYISELEEDIRNLEEEKFQIKQRVHELESELEGMAA